MIVGILQIELSIDQADTLKDKRRVVKSLKDRLHRRHLVSVAEVDLQEHCQSTVLGIVLASSSVPHCQSTLDRIVEDLKVERDCVLENHRLEILTGQ